MASSWVGHPLRRCHCALQRVCVSTAPGAECRLRPPVSMTWLWEVLFILGMYTLCVHPGDPWALVGIVCMAYCPLLSPLALPFLYDLWP